MNEIGNSNFLSLDPILQWVTLGEAPWSQKRLLRGVNGIAALTFCDVEIWRPEVVR